MSLTDLPTLNVILNFISFVLVTFGVISIKKKNEIAHKKFMISAVSASVLFFISYTIYHYNVGSVPYPYYDWTRTLYFTILIPHVILSAVVWPFIIYILMMALRTEFEKHRKFARFIWPVWIFNTLSGLVVYFMLYIL